MKYIFTITQGRTGTGTLAEFFKHNDKDAFSVHELIGELDMGIYTPDVGILRRFNTVGLDVFVREFWQRKFNEIDRNLIHSGKKRWVETNHMHALGGLVEFVFENKYLREETSFIILDREPCANARSIYERCGDISIESMWMWFLGPRCKKALIDSAPYLDKEGGQIAWYVDEVQARKKRYMPLLKEHGVDFVVANIDGPWRKIIADHYGFEFERRQYLANTNDSTNDREVVERAFERLFEEARRGAVTPLPSVSSQGVGGTSVPPASSL